MARVEYLHQIRIVIPQGPLTHAETHEISTTIAAASSGGFILKAVAARQKDIGNQRDPHVVTEAVVLTFQKP